MLLISSLYKFDKKSLVSSSQFDKHCKQEFKKQVLPRFSRPTKPWWDSVERKDSSWRDSRVERVTLWVRDDNMVWKCKWLLSLCMHVSLQ